MQNPKTPKPQNPVASKCYRHRAGRALLFYARTGDPAGHLGPGSTYWLS